MKKFVLLSLALVALCLSVSEVNAWPLRRRGTSVSVSVNTYSSPQAAATDKANRMAARCVMAHLGGGFGGGHAEGVGCASTAAAALANCCFTGQRVCLASAVVRGSNGRYYACKIFR